MEINNNESFDYTKRKFFLMILIFLVFLAFVLGAATTYGLMKRANDKILAQTQRTYSYAINNLPICLPEIGAAKDGKAIVSYLISYDRINSERLSALQNRLNNEAMSAIFQTEIDRETKEATSLESAYELMYGEIYTPSTDYAYKDSDSYEGVFDSSEYLGILHGSLENLNRNYYIYALNSDNPDLVQAAKVFAEDKVNLVNAIQVYNQQGTETVETVPDDVE